MSINTRIGDWIATHSGKRFYPLDPRPEEIDINDIAHSLSNQCRFIGHCTQFYSVSQHSVLVSLMCDKEHALWGLLHDGTEAFLTDIPTPLKKMAEFEPYRRAEKQLMDVIMKKFGLDVEEPVGVKTADKRMLATEARDLTMTEGRGWAMTHEPYDFHIKPWTPDYAKTKFIARFHELLWEKDANDL